jgi:hypothetical protein
MKRGLPGRPGGCLVSEDFFLSDVSRAGINLTVRGFVCVKVVAGADEELSVAVSEHPLTSISERYDR